MNKEIISASQVKEVLNKIRIHHNTSYKLIVDHNKIFNVENEEWPVNEVIDTFDKSIEDFEKKIQLLNDKINRKETKIFVFGNVSVGKSKVINSLLKLPLFVSASSHTTSCFVHIMKSQHSSYLIKYNDKKEIFDNIDKLKERIEKLGTAHDIDNKDKLDVNESIEFHLPIKDNKILKEGTHIIDCPGAGNQEMITEAIEKHSEDADIFIFVMSNALTDSDKQFFKYQSKLSCKPDVFILVNRWDDTDQDDETATKNSKVSIIKQCSEFLKSECDLDCSEITDRIFFISAKEIFLLQVKGNKKEVKMTNKVSRRCQSFENFEKRLAQYITNPQQNKMRRYQKEKDKVDKDIIQKCIEGRKQILDLRNGSQGLNCENLLKSIKALKKSLVEPFKGLKSELKKIMDGGINKIAENKDVLNEGVVTDKITLLKKEVEEKIQPFTKDQEKKIVNYVKENLTQSSEIKSKMKMNKTSKVTASSDTHIDIPDAAVEESTFLSTIASSLAAFRVGGVLATVGAAVGVTLLKGAEVVWNFYWQSEIKANNIKDVKKQLDKIKTNIIISNEKYIDQVKDHYDKTIQLIGEFIKKQKELTDNYWKEMEIILVPWRDLEKNYKVD